MYHPKRNPMMACTMRRLDETRGHTSEVFGSLLMESPFASSKRLSISGLSGCMTDRMTRARAVHSLLG
jgi:hypothetical protein